MSEENKAETLPKYIIEDMTSNLYLFGLIKDSEKEGIISHIPIGLSPSPISENLFNKINFYQIAFNKIIDKIAKNQELIEEILTPISEKDEFIKKCLEISKKLSTCEFKSKFNMAFLRNDYMVDKNKKFIFLNDINTQNVGLFSYSDKLKKFFNYFMEKYTEQFKSFLGNDNYNKIQTNKADTVSSLAKSMIDAIKLKDGKVDDPNLHNQEELIKYLKTILIVFIVNSDEKNNFELRTLENYLYDNYYVNVKYMTLADVTKLCLVDEKGNITTEEKQISLFYFATGRTEKDYKDENDWKGREIIELSNAIKCPSINLLLASQEIFINKLRDSEFIKKFITDGSIIEDTLRFLSPSYYVADLSEDKRKELFENLFKNINSFYLKTHKKDIIFGDKISTVIPNETAEINDIIKNTFIIEKIDSTEFNCSVIIKENVSQIVACSSFSCFGIELSINLFSLFIILLLI